MKIIGTCRLWGIDDLGCWQLVATQRNTLMATFGQAACRLFGFGDSSYRISKMYVEYENVASPSDPVTPPSYTNMDTRSYYDNLTAPRDYLRVDTLSNPSISIKSGYETLFPAGEGNVLTFYAQTAGSVGMNGLTFSDSVNSKVFGMALVAAPENADKTKDVIVTRAYFATGDQKLKAASGQVGITWDLEFVP